MSAEAQAIMAARGATLWHPAARGRAPSRLVHALALARTTRLLLILAAEVAHTPIVEAVEATVVTTSETVGRGLQRTSRLTISLLAIILTIPPKPGLYALFRRARVPYTKCHTKKLSSISMHYAKCTYDLVR